MITTKGNKPELRSEIIALLADGPMARSSLLPGLGSNREITKRVQMGDAIDALMEEGAIKSAHGEKDTFFYLTSQEEELISEGHLSRNEKPVPELINSLDPWQAIRYYRELGTIAVAIHERERL